MEKLCFFHLALCFQGLSILQDFIWWLHFFLFPNSIPLYGYTTTLSRQQLPHLDFLFLVIIDNAF